MKRNLLVLSLATGSLLLPLSAVSGEPSGKNPTELNQKETLTPKNKNPVYDIDGKQFRPEERFILAREVKNGRTIGYRRNKREIAALVSDLKKDGVIDKNLLNPRTWSSGTCSQNGSGGCQTDGSCTSGCRKVPIGPDAYDPHGIKDRSMAPNVTYYCVCN
jgi:hypothetical protein